MQRESLVPRPDWPQQMEELGFQFHSIDGVYWDETACYRFTLEQIETIEDATNELHEMCVAAAQHVIDKGLYSRFAIPEPFIELIEASWEDDEPSLYGRFDLSWDGRTPPKMLEYNADTPTALLEASVAQWHWLEAVKPDADQFNSIHEKLIASWQDIAADLPNPKAIHFTCVATSDEDVGNLEYLRDTATQAGIDARFVAIEEIGWNGESFVDQIDRPIHVLFKLYPWEWLVREPFGKHLIARPCLMLEPAWKMLMSNKAILPVLWELYPDHPNLLPASFDAGKFASDWVKKPILSREGANITIHSRGATIASDGDYGEEGFIWQAYAPLPQFDGNFPVIGSWVIGGEAAGIGIREDDSQITKNTSRFVPHYFVE